MRSHCTFVHTYLICADFHGVCISLIKNLAEIHNLIFLNGKVPTVCTYVRQTDYVCTYLTKYSQLNFHGCRLNHKIYKNEFP